MGTWYNKS